MLLFQFGLGGSVKEPFGLSGGEAVLMLVVEEEEVVMVGGAVALLALLEQSLTSASLLSLSIPLLAPRQHRGPW